MRVPELFHDNVGNLVKANDTPFLVQLNQVTPIYVTFSVPEQISIPYASFAAGTSQGAGLSLRVRTDHPAEGKLTFIDNGVDTDRHVKAESHVR